MLTPIDDTIARQNLFPVFRPVFDHIRKNYVQPLEKIFAVACCTYMNEYKNSETSLVVVTEHRWIRANFKYYGDVKEVSYRKSGSALGSLFGGQYTNWKWIEQISIPNGSRSSSTSDDVQQDVFIRELPLSKIQVTDRNDYEVEFENKPLSLVEIRLNNIEVVFRESDGNIVYAALQEAAKNKGRILTSKANTVDNPTESLKKLKELLELGLITETEYESKKQEILARL